LPAGFLFQLQPGVFGDADFSWSQIVTNSFFSLLHPKLPFSTGDNLSPTHFFTFSFSSLNLKPLQNVTVLFRLF